MGQDKIRIAVICHDAGASEILAAYIKEHFSLASWKLYASKGSPFEAIARRNTLKTSHVEEMTLSNTDALFFGTGWQNKIERGSLLEAKRLHIPSFAFLDHWSAYRERFDYPQKDWEKNLPDFTIVSDKKAQAIAKSYDLPHILLVKNFYLQKQLEALKSEDIPQTKNLLFLSEPTDKVALRTFKDKNYWGFTQMTALEEILTHFEKFECTGLHIRLHPSEKNHAYSKVLNKFPHIRSQIYPAAFLPLEKDLIRSKIIIGFDTMALYTASLANKALVSYLPSKNREFLLPLPPSHQLRNLNNLAPIHLRPLKLEMDSDGIDFACIEQYIKGFNQ